MKLYEVMDPTREEALKKSLGRLEQQFSGNPRSNLKGEAARKHRVQQRLDKYNAHDDKDYVARSEREERQEDIRTARSQLIRIMERAAKSSSSPEEMFKRAVERWMSVVQDLELTPEELKAIQQDVATTENDYVNPQGVFAKHNPEARNAAVTKRQQEIDAHHQRLKDDPEFAKQQAAIGRSMGYGSGRYQGD